MHRSVWKEYSPSGFPCNNRAGVHSLWYSYRRALEPRRQFTEATILSRRRSRNPYDAAFFALQAELGSKSAEIVVPVFLEVLKPYRVRSAVDVGCGVGVWLKALEHEGVDDILGIDGPSLAMEHLVISEKRVIRTDLTGPIDVRRRFDLAISLEVAEHLPEVAARDFVALLVRLSDVIVFSAAIPRQGGAGHVNEQWQDYWRKLFSERSYSVVDAIRPRIWDDERVAGYYRQNILIYVSSERLNDLPQLELVPPHRSIDLVHPQVYKSQKTLTFGAALRKLPGLFVTSLKKHMARRARG
ncbi:MAG TPA: methyltransferase domain-containing protein [Stellaceae bacterium]|nr:methyltransferase domain-containing protein [Stellaceae bacterium]